MNYTKITETKNEINNLNSRLELLEELHKETLEKILETQKSCSHEFILINKKYRNLVYDFLQFGKCLVCGCSITLTSTNVEIDKHEIIDAEKIINVAGEVEEWNLDCDCNTSKSDLEEAQRVFDSLINNDELCSRDFIKNEIIKSIKDIKTKTK